MEVGVNNLLYLIKRFLLFSPIEHNTTLFRSTAYKGSTMTWNHGMRTRNLIATPRKLRPSLTNVGTG